MLIFMVINCKWYSFETAFSTSIQLHLKPSCCDSPDQEVSNCGARVITYCNSFTMKTNPCFRYTVKKLSSFTPTLYNCDAFIPLYLSINT